MTSLQPSTSLAVCCSQRTETDELHHAKGIEHWSPQSWRRRSARQQPTFPCIDRVRTILSSISSGPSLVREEDVSSLIRRLHAAKAFTLQLGDCAESIDQLEDVNRSLSTCAFLKQVATTFKKRFCSSNGMATRELILIGRVAGQFVKPRSSSLDATGLPSFRGDMVHSVYDRRPDPERILRCHQGAKSAITCLDQCNRDLHSPTLYTSHECLFLDYEEALLRQDCVRRWFCSSAHMLWVGHRTKKSDEAHIELLRGVSNPVGLKVGPDTDIRDLVDAVRKLLRLEDRKSSRAVSLCSTEDERDAEYEPAFQDRPLFVITRLGVPNVDPVLGEIVESLSDFPVSFMCDPMHGNTFYREDGTKCRAIDDMVEETILTASILKRLGRRLSGLHLEVTNDDVIECCFKKDTASSESYQYESLCDPRLNPSQLNVFFDALETHGFSHLIA